MTQNDTPTPIETTTVNALVTLTVAPREGQTPTDAAAEMLVLFTEYLTEREYTFLTDYGTTVDELTKFRAGEDDAAEQPTWGGYEGPYVLESKVEGLDVHEAAATGSQWYREIGDTYARISAQSGYLPAKEANAAEAAKYYRIAERLEAVTPQG